MIYMDISNIWSHDISWYLAQYSGHISIYFVYNDGALQLEVGVINPIKYSYSYHKPYRLP